MRRTLLSVMAGAVVAVGAALAVNGGAKAAVGGPTCNVPGDYATIQAAVNDAGCATVKVAKGTYNENVVINRSLTLKGAKSGHNVNYRTPAGPQESTIAGVTDTAAVTVNAPNVTVEGFSITNPGRGIGLTVKTAGNNAAIKNNIVDSLGGPSYANHTVGIYLELGPDNVKVTDNKVSRLQSANPAGSPGTAQGILVGDSSSSNPSLGIEIAGNTIDDVKSLTRGTYGIQLNNGSSAAATGYTTAKIKYNAISNLNGNWAHGIGLEGDTPNVVVKYNTVKNITDHTPTPVNDASAVVLENNVFFFTGDINRNNFNVGSNAHGIAVAPALTALYPTLSVDGTCNYWGAKNGPSSVGTGSGSHVTAGVDYKPWLKSAKLEGQCSDDRDRRDYNDHRHGHGWDDKDRGRFWDED